MVLDAKRRERYVRNRGAFYIHNQGLVSTHFEHLDFGCRRMMPSRTSDEL